MPEGNENSDAQRRMDVKRQAGSFDVFLCHNSADKPQVKEIGNRLMAEYGLLPWLDEWELRPGNRWQRVIEEQITTVPCAAVFLGASGMGPWQDIELEAFLPVFVGTDRPLIPVILSEGDRPPQVPPFLQGRMWVDFCRPDPDPMEQLVFGITGAPARPPIHIQPQPNPLYPVGPSSQYEKWKSKRKDLQDFIKGFGSASTPFDLAAVAHGGWLSVRRRRTAGHRLDPAANYLYMEIADAVLKCEKGWLKLIVNLLDVANRRRLNCDLQNALRSLMEQLFDPELEFKMIYPELRDTMEAHGIRRDLLSKKEIDMVYIRFLNALRHGPLRDVAFEKKLEAYLSLKIRELSDSKLDWSVNHR